MKKINLKQWAAALLAAAAMTAVAASGVLSTAESAASDALYQHPVATDGEIVIIGMDQYALDQLGPLPWPRQYMADVVSYLNSDPENAPAVIGLDVLYIGHSGDLDADAALVEAAAMGDNVVVAGAATFGSVHWRFGFATGKGVAPRCGAGLLFLITESPLGFF